MGYFFSFSNERLNVNIEVDLNNGFLNFKEKLLHAAPSVREYSYIAVKEDGTCISTKDTFSSSAYALEAAYIMIAENEISDIFEIQVFEKISMSTHRFVVH